MKAVVGSYLPESMIIKIGPDLRLLDNQGKPVAFPTPETFGFFFHEYTHYLHNISTASGIAVFFNTLELWRCFRLTHDTTSYCNGSDAFHADRKEFLKSLLACLKAARRSHPPSVNVSTPVTMTISYYRSEPEVHCGNGALFTALKYEAEIRDSHGQSEAVSGSIGTLELLECAAWLLEKRVVRAVSPANQAQSPPIFPYRVVQAFAEHALPGVDEDTVLPCVLAALQSTDAPAALLEVLKIARQAIHHGKNSVEVLRDSTKNAIKAGSPEIEQAFGRIEREFNGNGIMAVAIRRIIAAAREAFRFREVDPFFELDFIDQLSKRTMSIDDVMKRIPSCAVLQRNTGSDDKLQRDFLLSFLPSNADGSDPEDGLRVVHSIFHYLGCHRETDGFVPTNRGSRAPCPFFTCCNLALRRKVPSICGQTPWEAADWPDWDEKGTCWYGTGVRITRPPSD